MNETLAGKAERLRALHYGVRPLVLVNAWDVASAKVLDGLGFPAIATASAGVSASLGFEDDESIGRDAMLSAVARIAAAVEVPLTADLQAGYGPGVGDAEATASGAIAAGAAGMNFEDTVPRGGALYDASAQAQRIRAIRRVATDAGVPLVINARTDAYMMMRSSAEQTFAEAVRRAKLYLEAGADCIYVLGPKDEATIARLVAAIPAPLNFLAFADAPSLARMEQLGVKRISFGPRPIRYAMQAFRDAAMRVCEGGDFP